MIKAKQFLDTIFSELDDDEHVCVSRATPKKDSDGVWFNNFTTDARQWRKWDCEAQAQAWYFCVSTIDGELNDKGKMVGRGRKNLKRYHCIVLDDIGTKGSPPPVGPSWKVTTSVKDGVENQQWGYLLDPGDDWNTYEAVVEWCAAQGWADAGAGGSYRLMRVPGSANMKPGRQEYRTHVTEANWPVWSLPEFMDDMGCSLNDLEIKDVEVREATGGYQAMDGIDLMLDWLSDNGHVVRDSGSEWVDIVCPWADSHTSGENIAGYSPLGRGSGKYVQTRAFKCLHEHCKDRLLTKFREWATKEGAPSVSGYDPMPWLQDKYVYVEKGQMFFDLHQRPMGGVWEWDWADWDKRYPDKITPPGRDNAIKIVNAFIEDDNTTRAVSTMYHPVSRRNDHGIVERLGQTFVNTYVPPNWKETDETPHVFTEHMEYLIPNVVERETFYDWFAYKIQHPTSRSFAVVMVAEDAYGTGRSWIGRLLDAMMPGHVNRAGLAQLVGRGTSAEQNYNDWMVGCQFLIVEEAKDNSLSREDFYNSYETFKQNVEPGSNVSAAIRVNEKYGRTRDEVVYFNPLIFTNHADALLLEEGDRRVYCVENPTERLEYDYYDRLAGSLQTQEPCRVYWWLMHRDLKDFDHIYPDMTPSKARMIEDNRKPSDIIGEWILENHGSDLVTRPILKTAVVVAARDVDDEKNMREPGNITKILWKKLKTLRSEDAKNGARYFVDGKQTEVRAIRNQEKWVSKDAARDVDDFKKELAKANLPSNVVNIRAE